MNFFYGFYLFYSFGGGGTGEDKLCWRPAKRQVFIVKVPFVCL